MERTRCLWITWVVDACKAAGVAPLSLSITFSGCPLTMTRVELTFGTRYYWLCPRCSRRCEVVYATSAVGCRHCLRLGYLSQSHRPGSAWSYLDHVFDRNVYGLSRRYDLDKDAAKAIVGALRLQLAERLTDLVSQVYVSPASEDIQPQAAEPKSAKQ